MQAHSWIGDIPVGIAVSHHLSYSAAIFRQPAARRSCLAAGFPLTSLRLGNHQWHCCDLCPQEAPGRNLSVVHFAQQLFFVIFGRRLLMAPLVQL